MKIIICDILYSLICMKCKKSEQLNICKFSLIHIHCAKLDLLEIPKYSCKDCLNDSIINNNEY